MTAAVGHPTLRLIRYAVGPWTLATTDYGGSFSSVVRRDNFMGAQFHPERSGVAGARLLANFLGRA